MDDKSWIRIEKGMFLLWFMESHSLQNESMEYRRIALREFTTMLEKATKRPVYFVDKRGVTIEGDKVLKSD